ncbi:hypothetical protein L208DRAFT_1408150 [Tricholoma matsutake]|nr:hypothetical protein L208DRAFT_1408150 [Tricholoma matsutake 945]
MAALVSPQVVPWPPRSPVSILLPPKPPHEQMLVGVPTCRRLPSLSSPFPLVSHCRQ